jgi:hypothetical protein
MTLYRVVSAIRESPTRFSNEKIREKRREKLNAQNATYSFLGHAFDTVGSIGMWQAGERRHPLALFGIFFFSNPSGSFIFFRHLQSDVFRHGTFLLKHCRVVMQSKAVVHWQIAIGWR